MYMKKEGEYESPLISVIVPIYNVAPYIRKCLDSLRAQTLKYIEIICIDDGSTDNSGNIANEYVSESWPVFKVLHTDNYGLSAARNRGIDEARSNYIMFVDSDDWVEKQYCELPYNTIVANNADMIIFQADEVYGKKISQSKEKKNQIEFIDEYRAYKDGRIVVWNKLYRKYLFEKIRYPEGRTSEDIAITHKIIHRAKKIVLISDCLYHHNNRRNSISYTNNDIHNRSHFISVLERYNDLLSYGYNDEENEIFRYSAAIRYLSRTKPNTDNLFKEAEGIVNSIIGIPKSLNKNQRIALAAWKKNKKLFYLISKLSGRMKKT